MAYSKRAKAPKAEPADPRAPVGVGKTLRDAGQLTGSRSARLLDAIQRDMQIKDTLMRKRRRNEEVLSLAYLDSSMLGGGDDTNHLRQNALNLPYRYVRWIESQATSKKMVVKVNRDAGAGQVAGGPDDAATGEWVGTTLRRAAYIGGLETELRSVIGEMIPRGTSVLRIGYHEEAITLAEAQEVGKDAVSVIPEVLGEGDVEAKPGQAHAEISDGLAHVASDRLVQAKIGREGVGGLLARKSSHDEAEYAAETDDTPRESTRLIRRRVWVRKKRVGEDVGWSPHVYDVEDTQMWWERHIWTVAEVRASDLFSDAFKAAIHGLDARNESGVFRGGKMPSTNNMGADARTAQGEDVLDDDERFVEWFEVWIRRPDMKSQGVRKIVSAEWPQEFCEADESNPHVNEKGEALIPGFFPFYDYTPLKSSLTVPERTCGIPPMAVGMPQFEQLAECNRLLHESSLRHSLRLYEIHPALKDNKKLLDALKDGVDGFSYVANQAQVDPTTNKVQQGVTPIQFSGNTLELDRVANRLKSEWVEVMGMPPAILQGVGTAPTATQESQGIAAGERESAAIISYCERRTADVMAGLRGLIRGCYDDEDFVELLGEEGAAAMKAWKAGTVDDGDEIEVTFGANAQAQETVDKKQLMEGIQLENAQIDPVTGLGLYDTAPLFEELHRKLDLGKPKPNATVLAQLQQIVIAQQKQIAMLTGTQTMNAGGNGPMGGPPAGKTNAPPQGGPNPAEGKAPTAGNLTAGAVRGAVEPKAAG